MNYQILANKWRPKILNDIVGQEEVIYTIKNIIKTKSIHQAYLITGSQGIGKTTLARIITKCINCKTNITVKPCDQCTCCTSIDNGKNPDSIEVDAASKTKVEDIKELINLSNYKNIQNRFKTYIIDECHMLSINSFNSLLKILEEANKKIIYILVTTQFEKIPKTIVSRCIHLCLKKISNFNIKKRLIYILKNEKITYDEDVINYLVMFSDGSVRQALNTLERINKTKNITKKNTKLLLGITSDLHILSIIKNIYENNIIDLIKNIKHLVEENYDLFNTLTQIQIILYLILLHKIKINYNKNLLENKIFLYLSKKLETKTIQKIYNIISKEKSLIEFTPNISIGFEMILIKIVIKINKNIEKKEAEIN